MTDTTDVAALRESAESIMNLLENLAGYEPQDIDMDAVELRFEDENGFDTGCDISIVDTAQQSADVIRALLNHLEAERQRADALQSTVGRLAQESNRLFDDRQRINKSWTEAETDNALLRDEIAALKGDQVPVGVYNYAIFCKAGSATLFSIEEAIKDGFVSESGELTHNREYLFTAPQKLVVLPGISELIDACDSTPAVRDVHVWDLAISEVKRLNPSLFSDKSAAGGIVKDGEC